jgi:hypothetical protein
MDGVCAPQAINLWMSSSTCKCRCEKSVLQVVPMLTCHVVNLFCLLCYSVSDSDGDTDCEPIPYPRCDSSLSTGGRHKQLTQSGKCADDSYCDTVCPVAGGSIDPASGLCLCRKVDPVDTVSHASARLISLKRCVYWLCCGYRPQICDSECIGSMPSLELRADGTLVVQDPTNTTSANVTLEDIAGYIGELTCSIDTCNVYSMAARAEGYAGQYWCSKRARASANLS